MKHKFTGSLKDVIETSGIISKVDFVIEPTEVI